MNIESQIQSIVGELNSIWFNKLKEEFVRHPFYNEKSGFIDDAIQRADSIYDPETGESIEYGYDVVIQATLPEYAWKGERFFISDEEDFDLVLKANSVTPQIFAIIEPLLNETSNLKDKYNLIRTVTNIIIENGEILKKEFSDKSYEEVISYCIQMIRVEINKKYKNISRAHDTFAIYEDKLLFNLNQKELAFLLTLLVKCNFIEGTNFNNNHLDFFRKFFYFKNQKESNRFQKAKDIHKKMSDVASANNTAYQSIKEDIKNKLIEAIKEL